MDAGCWKQRGEENDSRRVGELAYLSMESSPLVVAIVSIGLFIIGYAKKMFKLLQVSYFVVLSKN